MRRVLSCLGFLAFGLLAVSPQEAGALTPGQGVRGVHHVRHGVAPARAFVHRHGGVSVGAHHRRHAARYGYRHGFGHRYGYGGVLPAYLTDERVSAPSSVEPAYPSELTVRTIPELPTSNGIVTEPAGTPALYVIHADGGPARRVSKGGGPVGAAPGLRAPTAGERSLVPHIVHVTVPRG